MNNSSLTLRIKNQMRETGVTQDQLAKALGCTRAAVGHYLSNRRRLRLEQIALIAHALGRSPVWIQYGDEYFTKTQTRFPILGDITTGPLEAEENTLCNEFAEIPADCYALKIIGTDLPPSLLEGDLLLISPSHALVAGSSVFTRFSDGELGVFNLININEDHVFLGPSTSQRRIKKLRSDIRFMHCIVATVCFSSIKKTESSVNITLN